VKMSNVQRARAQIESAEINEVTQTYSLASQVKTQFYNILRQREALVTARIQLDNAQLQYRLAVSRLTNGTATIADTLNAVIAIYTANNSILNAQNSVDNANAQLTRLTGSDSPVTAILSDTSDPPPMQITDRELFQLVEQGPAVRSSAAQIAVAKAAEKSSKAVYWPTIRATGSFSRNNSERSSGGFDGYDFGAGPMNYSWGFGINASYQIWNGFQRESQILTARVQRDNAEANYREAKLTARQSLTSQLGTLRTNEAQLGLGRLQLAAANEALRVIQRRYELGAATQLELQNAQQQVVTARNSLSNSRFDVRTARAAIEALIGRDIQQ
jgi:outer membrane protein